MLLYRTPESFTESWPVAYSFTQAPRKEHFNNIQLMLFTMSTCGACHRRKEELCKTVAGVEALGLNTVHIVYDRHSAQFRQINTMCELYNVQQFPTVLYRASGTGQIQSWPIDKPLSELVSFLATTAAFP